jgi:hypothetical protein
MSVDFSCQEVLSYPLNRTFHLHEEQYSKSVKVWLKVWQEMKYIPRYIQLRSGFGIVSIPAYL